MNLNAKIEAILFWKAEPVSIKKLASLLSTDDAKISEDEVKAALIELEKNLVGRGVTLVQTDEDVMLGTAKELSPLIEQLTKDELSRDLGKAGLETLSIVLYQGPISRADIDYIRGVNSQFILRALLIRGLVERVENPADARSYLYKTTLDLLSHLGISKVTDLPEYEAVRKDIEAFNQATQDNQTEQTSSNNS
ncbi:MAG: SMC-Scp complex subunit ScpB [Candidatus Pacebacteria bacterium]|nr:SMC-Scp complex subunit ScpB [Candidatus Paceibacterota bacterium]